MYFALTVGSIPMILASLAHAIVSTIYMPNNCSIASILAENERTLCLNLRFLHRHSLCFPSIPAQPRHPSQWSLVLSSGIVSTIRTPSISSIAPILAENSRTMYLDFEFYLVVRLVFQMFPRHFSPTTSPIPMIIGSKPGHYHIYPHSKEQLNSANIGRELENNVFGFWVFTSSPHFSKVPLWYLPNHIVYLNDPWFLARALLALSTLQVSDP